MVNKELFTKRLNDIITEYEESASSFAETIDVPRSSISHIMSGRNNPSLDFVMKIIKAYPNVNLYWLLYGKGQMHQSNLEVLVKAPTENKNSANQSRIEFKSEAEHSSIPSNDITSNTNNKVVERIVILYNDGSFSSYTPS